MRLGELLLQRNQITPEELRAALDGQAMFGGRLGSNLVRLGVLDLDTLSRALGDQQGRCAVRSEQVAAIDPRVIALFSGRVVSSYRAIPIGHTSTTPPRVIVACADPTTVPVEELAFAAGKGVDVWVAPEMLVQECLERYFGVARAKKGAGGPDEGLQLGADLAEPAPAPPRSGRRPEPGERTPPPVLELPSQPPPPVESAPRLLEPPPAPRAPVGLALDDALPPEDGWDTESAPPVDARRPDAAPDHAPPASEPPESAPEGAVLHPVIDTPEASRLLEMATSKEHVGRVLEDWLRSTFGCGLVLVVKGDMALGWKGFFQDAEDLVEAVAVPLGKPSLFSEAYGTRRPFCGPPPKEGMKADALLWKLLRCAPPAEVIVCPVVLANRVVNLLYAHDESGAPLTDTVFREAQVLAGGAGGAYARLIRKEQRKR